VSAGLVYARDYPKYVTRATHSLHMPSHLFDRSGDFRSGELSNRASVWAGDTFARGGALSDIGNAPPFSFNAGNLYHSLEYEHYELLQMCALGKAGSRLRRMIRATSQAMSNESEPWYRATTFTQWEMKMVARQTMWAVAASLMSSSSSRFLNRGASLRRGSDIDVDSAAAQNKDADEQEMRWREQWIGISTAPALPRLSWKGTTVYSHSFYSPSAEAGYYAALAVALLFETLQKETLDGARANIGALGDKAVDTDVCGSYPMPNGPNGPNGIEEDVGDLDCVGPRVAAALTIIDGAAAHYTNLGIHYEANFAEQLGFQVRGLLHIVNGDTTAASAALSAATALERDARGIILPSSTSVFFMPSSAWEGVLRHTLMSSATDAAAAAAEAFAQCLSDDGHPNMPLCLVGSARLSSDSASSSTRYLELLKQWGALQNGTLSLPRCECSALLEEARIAVGWQSGRSGSGSVSGQGNGPEWATGSVVLVGTGGLLAGMVLGALLLHFGLRSRKREWSGSTCAVPFPQQNVENNRLLSGDASR
jgi:hypothetical protein